MRIGMCLLHLPYPPDFRIEKELEILTDAGHEVVVLAKRGKGQPDVEQLERCTVVRHEVHPGNPLSRQVDSLTYLTSTVSPSWLAAVKDFIREQDIDVLHHHELQFAATSQTAARDAGIPFVLDLHENYPAAFALYDRRLRDRLLLSPARAGRIEAEVARKADRVVVVVDEAKQRIAAEDVDPAKIVVFGNMEPRRLAEESSEPVLGDGGLRIVYVGGIAKHRGLQTAIDAMPQILAERPDATLTIVGGGDYEEALRVQATALSLGDAVTFTGKLPFAQAMQHVSDATIATVPHLRSPHTDATIPHKLFQYMALGKPVLVSDCLPLERVVRDTHSGGVFVSEDPASFAVEALKLADPQLALECGKAGREAILGEYNMEADGRHLTDMYASLEKPSA